MGKSGEEDHSLPSTVAAEDPWRNAVGSGCIFSVVGIKCVIVLLFSVAVFLSALFWLPPFVHFADPKDLHFNSKYKGEFLIFFKQIFGTLSLKYLSLFSIFILILGKF